MESIYRQARISQPTFVAGHATAVVGMPVASFHRPVNVFYGHFSHVASAVAALANQHTYNPDADKWWMYQATEAGRPKHCWIVQSSCSPRRAAEEGTAN
jgi:hypothetical protein